MSIQFDDDDFVTIPPIKRSLDSQEIKTHRLKEPKEKKPSKNKSLVIAIISVFIAGLVIGFFIGVNNPFSALFCSNDGGLLSKLCQAHYNFYAPTITEDNLPALG